jgi:predicted DNA-binding protein YlxM (UPF0122 family)
MGIIYKQLHNRDWLYQKYWGEKLNMREIAEELGCTREQIAEEVKQFMEREK